MSEVKSLKQSLIYLVAAADHLLDTKSKGKKRVLTGLSIL